MVYIGNRCHSYAVLFIYSLITVLRYLLDKLVSNYICKTRILANYADGIFILITQRKEERLLRYVMLRESSITELAAKWHILESVIWRIITSIVVTVIVTLIHLQTIVEWSALLTSTFDEHLTNSYVDKRCFLPELKSIIQLEIAAIPGETPQNIQWLSPAACGSRRMAFTRCHFQNLTLA